MKKITITLAFIIGFAFAQEFEVDGDAVTYTVRAENVLDAESAAKKKLKNDIKIRTKAYRKGSSTSSWKVKQIENIKDAW